MKKLFFLLKVLALFFAVVMAHLYSGGNQPGKFDPELEADWNKFSKRYGIAHFGRDGYFVRAIRHGHGLVNRTYDFAWRFTRKKKSDTNNSCASCHTPEDLAFAFVKSDRFDKKAGKRLSFEEQVMRCYVKHLDGFMPTIYDPAIRDIRIYARAVAHHYQLVEGAIRPPRTSTIAGRHDTGKPPPVTRQPSPSADKKPALNTADRNTDGEKPGSVDSRQVPVSDKAGKKTPRRVAARKGVRRGRRFGVRPHYRKKHAAQSRRSVRRKSRLKRARYKRRYKRKKRRTRKKRYRRAGS